MEDYVEEAKRTCVGQGVAVYSSVSSSSKVAGVGDDRPREGQ